MIIPLGTDRPLHRPTRVVYVLMAINVVCFMAQKVALSMGPNGPGWLDALVLRREGAGLWAYVTYAFLHDPSGIWHIAGNLLFLWVFGPAVEDRFGRIRFAAFYLAGAVIAGIAHVVSTRAGVVGASGAIAAVTGAFIVLFPKTRVKSIWLLGLAGFIMVPAWFFIGLAVARDLFSVGLSRSMGVANEAHLGGYVFGAALSFTLLATGLLSREPYDLFSVLRQGKRRREIRAAARSGVEAKRRHTPAMPEMDPLTDAIAAQRAAVTRALAEGRPDDAISAYELLVEKYAEDRPAAVTLNRRAQFQIGGELYKRGRHELADRALARYVDAYPTGRETAEVRVLLARIKGRYLGQTDAARALLESAIQSLSDGDVLAAAKAELANLRHGGGATA